MADEAKEGLAGMPEISAKQMKEIIASADAELANVTEEVIEAAAQKITKQDVIPMKALGVTPEMMEGIYSHAYNMYNRGLYKDGANIFRLLLMLDFREPKYCMGLSACLHMEKNFEAAAQMYMMTAALDPGNPLPYYHAADCYIQLDKPTSARKSLEFAIDIAGDDPKYTVLVERSKLMHEALLEASEQELARYKARAEKRAAKKAAKAKRKANRAKKK